MQIKDYFPDSELACKCCGKMEIRQRSFERLVAARIIAGVPFCIVSGYRCKAHNRAVGSVTTNHVEGFAFDVACTDSRARDTLIGALRAAGFRRMGIGPKFIHVDDNPANPPGVTWIY